MDDTGHFLGKLAIRKGFQPTAKGLQFIGNLCPLILAGSPRRRRPAVSWLHFPSFLLSIDSSAAPASYLLVPWDGSALKLAG